MVHPARTLLASLCLGLPLACAPSPPAAPPSIDVHIASVQRGTVSGWVDAYGRVLGQRASADQVSARATVAAPHDARVLEVRCAPGDTVSVGEVLFVLDARVDDAEVRSAARVVRYAQARLDRERRLLAQGNSSQQRVESVARSAEDARGTLAMARARRSLTQLTTPIDGVVSGVYATVGEGVASAAPLAEVVDPSRLMVKVGVPPARAAQVRPGQRAQIVHTSAGPVQVWGVVTAVSPAVNPGDGAVPVEIDLDGQGLFPNELVQVRIEAQRHDGVWTIPEAALVLVDGGYAVQQVRDGVARRLRVSVGLRDAGRVEVRGEGLSDESQVVTLEAYGLPDGQPVHPLPAP